MPRKKSQSGPTRTLIVRVSEQIDDDLRAAAAGLGVDVSNLVRLIFSEQLPTYLLRGVDARQRAEAARSKLAHAAAAGPATSGQTITEPKPAPGAPPTRDLDI